MQEGILRIHEVADRSGLSRSSIYRLVHIGLFPKPFQIGERAIGWKVSDVERWLAERPAAYCAKPKLSPAEIGL